MVTLICALVGNTSTRSAQALVSVLPLLMLGVLLWLGLTCMHAMHACAHGVVILVLLLVIILIVLSHTGVQSPSIESRSMIMHAAVLLRSYVHELY